MTAEAAVMASNERAEDLAQRLLEWEQRARDAEAERDELMAHMEAGKELVFDFLDPNGRPVDYTDFAEWAEGAPTDFLTRLHAQWEREYLEDVAARIQGVLRKYLVA